LFTCLLVYLFSSLRPRHSQSAISPTYQSPIYSSCLYLFTCLRVYSFPLRLPSCPSTFPIGLGFFYGYNTPMSDDLEFFFPELNPAEDGVIPLPPQAMRILELKPEPVRDDGPTRMRVYLEVTAFQQRPYLEITLSNETGHEVASVSIIEPMQRKNVFTMHIRGPQQTGKFTLSARLFYPEQPDSDTRSVDFEI